MLNIPTGGPRDRGRRQFLIVAMGVGTGVVIVFSLVYAVSVLQWGQEDARKSAQQAQVAEQVQAEAQLEAARPRTRVVVARATVVPGTLLDSADFELREIAGGIYKDTLTSLEGLEGKMLSVPKHDGQMISSRELYDPSELTATAEIIAAEISPANVTVGDTLFIKVVVKNTSDRPLRTMGPEPGSTYETNNNPIIVMSATGQQPQFEGSPFGKWRVGIGWTGLDSTEPRYRWGLGADLAPGATTTVTGRIKITRYFEPTHFWVALMREPDTVMQNGAGMTVITSLPENIVRPPGR
jgi:hypothetical protein